jgi:hypothetical protein
MAQIFISYARADLARAQALAHALGQEGWSVWWDREIPPGRTFDEVIEAALGEARCVIVLWSRDSVRSEWVKSEASDAARRRILVPVLADQVTIPLEFRRIQSAALLEWGDLAANPDWPNLCQAVGTLLGTLPGRGAPGRLSTAGATNGQLAWERRKWPVAGGVAALCLLTAAAGLTWAVRLPPSEKPEPPPSASVVPTPTAVITSPPAAAQATPVPVKHEPTAPGGGVRPASPARRVPLAIVAKAEPASAGAGLLDRELDVAAEPPPEAPSPIGERASDDAAIPAVSARPRIAVPSFEVAYTRGVFRETGRLTVAADGVHYAESGGRSAFDASCDQVRRVQVMTRIVDPDQRMVEVHTRDHAHRFTAENIDARNGLVAALSRACGTR